MGTCTKYDLPEPRSTDRGTNLDTMHTKYLKNFVQKLKEFSSTEQYRDIYLLSRYTYTYIYIFPCATQKYPDDTCVCVCVIYSVSKLLPITNLYIIFYGVLTFGR